MPPPLVSVRRRFDCIVDQLHMFLRDFKTSGTCRRVDSLQVDLLASGATLFWPQNGRPAPYEIRRRTFFKSSGRTKIYDTQRWGGGGGRGSIISFLFSIPFANRPLPFSNETERAGLAYQGQRFYSQDHPSSSEETLEELDPR